jgi:hypothetical protein
MEAARFDLEKSSSSKGRRSWNNVPAPLECSAASPVVCADPLAERHVFLEYLGHLCTSGPDSCRFGTAPSSDTTGYDRRSSRHTLRGLPIRDAGPARPAAQQQQAAAGGRWVSTSSIAARGSDLSR